MFAKDEIKAVGSVKIVLTGSDGQIKDEREIHNLVVTTGKNFIASRMTGTTTAMSHMAIGSDNTAPAAANTGLGSELGRVALSSATTTSNITTYSATFPTGTGTGAVVEAGIFNASSSGTMLCRTTFAVVNKGANDTITITWTVTVN
jgi:hypothetical protein